LTVMSEFVRLEMASQRVMRWGLCGSCISPCGSGPGISKDP